MNVTFLLNDEAHQEKFLLCGKQLEFLVYLDTVRLVDIVLQCIMRYQLESVQVLVDVMQELENKI
jgi:phosphoserine aminotransferase